MALGPLSGPTVPLLPPRIDGGVPIGPSFGSQNVEAGEPSPFAKLLDATVGRTNESLLQAEDQARAFAEGKSDDIHGTMIAVAEADVRLRLLGTMKNKVVDAFYELWRMQI